MAAQSAPIAEPPAPLAGVIRLDGSSTTCSDVVAVAADGSASVMCTFDREDGCAIRRLGPDGEQVSRSDLAPGICADFAPREGGGGFLVTRAPNYQSITITSLDANGKRIAATSLTSKEEVWPLDASTAADGGLFVSLQFRRDLMFGTRRLGTTKYSTSGIVKLAPALGRLVWSRVFDTRRTSISALLPGTHGGVDALVNTRGPLVAGTPVNPPINPNDGSVFGGDNYGWKAERIAFDPRGKPVTRVDMTIEPRHTVRDAAQIGDAVVTLTANKTKWNQTNLTVVRAGQREQSQLGTVSYGLQDISGRTWVIDCDCTYENSKVTGTWMAHELGGAQMTIALGGAFGSSTTWTSIAVTGDRIAAVGASEDPVTGTPLTFVALAKLPPGAPAVDLARLGIVDHLALAPACRHPRTQIGILVSGQAGRAFDPALEACGVAPKTRIEMATFPDGGMRTFAIKDATPEVVACARRIFEPVVACPTLGTNVSFSVRLP